MNSRYPALIAAWRQSIAELQKTEKEVNAAFDDYLAGRGPGPTEAQRARIKVLTVVAQERLQAASAYINEQRRTFAADRSTA